MIKINVVCRTVFEFKDGVVTGKILVNADSILEAIFTNITLDYRHPCRSSIKKLISRENSKYHDAGEDPDIVLLNGVVDKNFIKMDMTDGLNLILEYVHFDDVIESEISNPSMRPWDKVCWTDLWKFKDYIIACEKCTEASRTANICFPEDE